MVYHKRTCCDYNAFKTLPHVWSDVLRNLSTFRRLSSLFTGFPLCSGRVSNFYALYFELCVALAPLYLQELICPYRPTRSLRSESKNLCSSLPHSHLREQVVQRRNRNPLERPAARNARCWEPLPRSQDCWKLTFLILSFLKIVVQYVLSVF